MKLFEQESQRGTDAHIRAFAAELLPGIQEHLRLARDLSAAGKEATGKESTNSNTNTRPNP